MNLVSTKTCYSKIILLIFTRNIYNSWKKHKLNINILLNNTAKVKEVEEEIASNNMKKTISYNGKSNR